MYTEGYYGVSMTLVDLDALYSEQKETILINEIAQTLNQPEAASYASRILKTEVSSDSFNTTPRCSCGHLDTQYDADIGAVCEKCNTLCVKALEQPIRIRSWIGSIYPMRGFIHPTLWMNILSTFSSFTLPKNNPMKSYDLVAWLTDPRYRPEKNPSRGNVALQDLILSWGYERGLNSFIENFDWLFERLLQPENFHAIQLSSKMLNRKKETTEVEMERQDWLRFIKWHRGKFFPTKLPIISDQLVLCEEGQAESKRNVDRIYVGMIDAAKTILSAYYHTSRKNRERIIQSRMVTANRTHAFFNFEFRRDVVFPKEGIARSKNNSTRVSYSGRATISSETGVHEFDHCKTPWRWTVNLLYLDIANKLLHVHNLTPIETIKTIDRALVTYDPFIHDVIKELIEEAPGPGIMIVPLRNPTLVRLSVWVLYITDVKTDVNDGSIDLSPLIIKQANADYDGDQIQVMMPRDNLMRRLANRLIGALSIMSRSKTNAVSEKLTLHAEIIALQSGFVNATVTDNEWDD